MSSKAVFLDRDGTIIEDRGYVRDPDNVTLLPGAGEAIRRLADAGNLIVVVSNQSGVARGLLDEPTLGRVHQRMEELLRAHQAPLHGVYYCPFLDGPEALIETYRQKSPMRKPDAGMLRKAAEDLDIDLRESWMIGDSAADIQAGETAGCRTILIHKNCAVPNLPVAPTHSVASLTEAADLLLKGDRPGKAEKGRLPSPARETDRTVELLEQISRQMERTQRTERHSDFSVIRLIAALLQMFAVVAAAWGIIALTDGHTGDAVARTLLAIFLQLASLTAFALDRFR